MKSTTLDHSAYQWVERGRTDIALFAREGLGIELSPPQLEVCGVVLPRLVQYILLTWAFRAGKTTLLIVLHMHHLWYKFGMDPPSGETQEEWNRDYRERWLPAGYRTLHCAPLNKLTIKAYRELQEILKGTSRAQRDPATKRRRPAPLLPAFSTVKERDEAGADHILLRCTTGGVMDFVSTEGGAARLEGEPWWFITWDEWPATEGDPENARFVLETRLTNRASDFGAPIVLAGTITEDMEGLAKEWLGKCEDPSNKDWWGNYAERASNPSANLRSIEVARRNFTPENFSREVMGRPGGMKGRMIPDYLLDNAFNNDLPNRTPPLPGDGTAWDERLKRRVDIGTSPYTYLTLVDTAISEADNVISTYRLPKGFGFSVEQPIEGVCFKIVPGSRTLTDDEIVLTIEETYLLYGGQVWIDTTDAHGINIARTLRNHGIPARDFDFKDRTARGETWKEAGIIALRKFLAEQQIPTATETLAGKHEQDVPEIDRSKPYGVIRIPKTWTKHRDQLSILKPPPDDLKQKKDAAMTDVMLAAVAQRQRPRGPVTPQRLVVFGGR